MEKEAKQRSDKIRKIFANVSAILLALSLWFAGLGVYLYNGITNYKPKPGEPQEGDFVSLSLMILMFAAALCFLIVSVLSFSIFIYKRHICFSL